MYERTPKEFMEGIFIAPHNFSDPENPEHGQYVHSEMRNDLYNTILFRISGCEFSMFGSEEEELKVQKIKKCEGADPVWGLSKLFDKKEQQNNKMLVCEDWLIQKKGTIQPNSYRVKIFQNDRDFFSHQIHPPTFWKLLRLYILG